MARSTADFSREQIIRGGYLKHRETGFVSKWRQRYVEFKFTQSGRISFVVYKDQSTSPANEVTQVLIEEYGGLDSTLKLDGEKHVFAIITTHSTECFATDSLLALQEWVALIQEYLGKELVMNIFVPHKQNVLKAGKGQIRIRNTGFTITTSDSPPKCQCTWQILHIRKFGGSESFRFETGSKCPSGEYLYCINTEDNAKMKSVFRDLSVHKPIFVDDRMGRRMTHEHNMLQKIRSGDHSPLESRHSVPSSDFPMYENHGSVGHRRISVPHNATTSHAFRPRSSAVFRQESMELRPSPSANLTGSRVYCNLESRNSKAPDSHDLSSLPTSPTHQIASPERCYYNMSQYPRADETNSQKSAGLSSPNDSDSDDDFVNVAQSIQSRTEYYNLRDALATHHVSATDEVERQLNYENFVPAANKPVLRFSATSDDDSQSHLYTNLTIGARSNPEYRQASTNNERLLKTPPPFVPKAEPTFLLKSDITEAVSLRPAASLHSSNSEDEDGDEDTRNRTTSIVENMLITSDKNSRSCEDLTAVVPPLLKTFKNFSSGNLSDSELLSDQSKQNPRSKSHRSHVEIVPESNHREASQGSNSKTLMFGEWNSSPAQNKLSRPKAYDHLVPREPQQLSSHLVTQSLTFVPSNSGVPNFVGKQASGEMPDVSERSPRDSRNTTPSPDHVVPSRKKSTFERRVKVTGRQHLYEDIDFQDEPATNLSRSSSPESCSSLPMQQEKMNRYKRKVSYTQRFHSYEDVVTECSVSQEFQSESSTPEALSHWVHAPSQLPNYSSTHPSPAHTKSLDGLSNTTRKQLPLQQTGLGDSTELHEKESDDGVRSKMSKKPVPTPRRGQKRDESSVTNQHLLSAKQGSFDGDSNTIGTSHSDDIIFGKQLQAPPSQGIVTSGSMSSISEEGVPPALPPKPEHSSYVATSLPRIPDKPRENRRDPNYMLVDISTKSVSATLPAAIKPLETTQKRDERVIYSEISHIKTKQLGNMIVERNKEKNQPNLKQ